MFETCNHSAEAERAAEMYGVDMEAFLKALTKPRVKVGAEWVNKGQNLEQVHISGCPESSFNSYATKPHHNNSCISFMYSPSLATIPSQRSYKFSMTSEKTPNDDRSGSH